MPLAKKREKGTHLIRIKNHRLESTAYGAGGKTNPPFKKKVRGSGRRRKGGRFLSEGKYLATDRLQSKGETKRPVKSKKKGKTGEAA